VDMMSDANNSLSILNYIQPFSHRLKAILISDQANVPFAVDAVKAGAFEVLLTPVDKEQLRSSVREALESLTLSRWSAAPRLAPQAASAAWARLTVRQREILLRILEGQPNKIIAADLGISQRTVENHRATIMKKMGASSISSLIQNALAGRTSP
jgi:two-component system CheB/CheR fusion protein